MFAPGATPGGRHVLSWRNPSRVVPSPAWWMMDVEEQGDCEAEWERGDTETVQVTMWELLEGRLID